MDWNSNSFLSGGMFKGCMTSFLMNHYEAIFLEDTNQVVCFDGRKAFRHLLCRDRNFDRADKFFRFLREALSIFKKAFQMTLDGFNHILLCFFKRFSLRMTTVQGRTPGMITAFFRSFNHNGKALFSHLGQPLFDSKYTTIFQFLKRYVGI